MSEALEEIVDLYETRSTAVSTKQRSGGQIYARHIMRRGHQRSLRMAFFFETKRPEPTLPRVKWLERPDP